MKRFLVFASLTASLSLAGVSPPDRHVTATQHAFAPREPFPITIDFDCPRNFGFHIGDEIPLTVTLEASRHVVVDLVNLPQKRENHGPFEIRDMKVDRHRKGEQTVYTVSYRLQSFTPAIAVDRLTFPPLRISYATKDDWNPVTSAYDYRNLLSQPFDILVSRTATFFGPMKDVKGPVTDRRAAVMWQVALVVGTVLTLLGLITWPWEFIRKKWQAERAEEAETAVDRAIQALEKARENCFNYDDHRKHLFFEINRILRSFLKEACDLRTANRPSMEILHQLRDRPFYENLSTLVTRINQVIYEGDAPVDVESIVRQFSGILHQVDKTTLSGEHHDQAG
jgi:hypothetical protein